MLNFVRGDHVSLPITITDSDDTAVNLTGSTVFFTVKKQLEDVDASAVIQKDITAHSNPTAGETQIDLTSSDTDIDPGTYHWDLQIKDSLGNISSIHSEVLKVVDDVTKRIT